MYKIELFKNIMLIYISNIMSEEAILYTVDLNSDSESESESELQSEESNLTVIPFYENIQESEMNDLISSIHELIDQYLITEILKMAKPDFHKEIVDDITHILFQNLQDAEICNNNDSDYDSLYDIVDMYCNIYFETKEDIKIPARSMEHSNYNSEHFGLCSEYEIKNKIENLRKLNEELPKQRTPEWYQRRYNMITASNLWQALNTESQRNRLIYEKCKPLDFGYTENKWMNTDSSLHWGVKYEPLTALLYEKVTGARIEEFGCIQHESYPFLGASPDGIVTNIESSLYGRMLEIKNIYNRDMDGTPSEAYWIQIQIQLQCCNLDLCDFVETRFKEYKSEIEFFEENDSERVRGLILYFIPKDGKSNVPLYKYMPLDVLLNQSSIDEWISNCKTELPEFAIYSKIYWYLDEMLMSTIEKNTKWFETALPMIKETWVTIEKERISGYEHRVAKKRIVNDVIVVNSTDGSDTHVIKNMPSNNSGICLIKIDSDENLQNYVL